MKHRVFATYISLPPSQNTVDNVVYEQGLSRRIIRSLVFNMKTHPRARRRPGNTPPSHPPHFRSSAANSALRIHPINFCSVDCSAPPDPTKLMLNSRDAGIFGAVALALPEVRRLVSAAAKLIRRILRFSATANSISAPKSKLYAR